MARAPFSSMRLNGFSQTTHKLLDGSGVITGHGRNRAPFREYRPYRLRRRQTEPFGNARAAIVPVQRRRHAVRWNRLSADRFFAAP
jgi:hypothetical protein